TILHQARGTKKHRHHDCFAEQEAGCAIHRRPRRSGIAGRDPPIIAASSMARQIYGSSVCCVDFGDWVTRPSLSKPADRIRDLELADRMQSVPAASTGTCMAHVSAPQHQRNVLLLYQGMNEAGEMCSQELQLRGKAMRASSRLVAFFAYFYEK
ncbi:unnamed protein product, partial [Urochloa humidicola]